MLVAHGDNLQSVPVKAHKDPFFSKACVPVGSIVKQQKNKLNWVPSLVFAFGFPWRDSSDVKTEFRDRNLITSGEIERERERLFRVPPKFSALNKDYVNMARKQIQHHTTLARPLQHSRHSVVWLHCNYISIVTESKLPTELNDRSWGIIVIWRFRPPPLTYQLRPHNLFRRRIHLFTA